MREAIIIGIVVGLLFFAAGVVMTALAVKYATSAILWDVLLWSGVALMLASLSTLALYIWSQTEGGAFWIPAMLLNIGICAVVSGVAYSYSTRPSENPTPKFSWAWDALPDPELRNLTDGLRDLNPDTVSIACNRRVCGKLADSLQSAFRAPGWTTGESPARSFLGGISGAVITSDSDAAQSIKRAVESNTNLRLAIVLPRFQAANIPLAIVIGGKPPPDPLPPDIKNDLAALGARLDQLSKEITHFVADREAAADLLPKRETYSPDTAGLMEFADRRMAFSRQTEVIFAERFGGQTARYLTELELLGIETPFGRDSAEDRGKWFGLIGDFLIKGNIIEARERGPDVRFWMQRR